MRSFATLVFALALLVALPKPVAAGTGEEAATNAAPAVYAKYRLPPQLMLRASYYLYLDAAAGSDTEAASDATEPNAENTGSAQADGGAATSESNLEEPVSSPARGSEVPDIDTLSQRSIEHYEAGSKQSGKRKGTGERSRGAKAGIAIGVVLGVGLVGLGIGAAVVAATFEL